MSYRNTLGALLLITLFSHNSVQAAEVLSIRADSWYPMNGEPGTAKPGYMIELAQTIMAHHGYQVDYQLLPWKRSLKYVNQGREDCVVGAYKADARELLFPEEPWGVDQVDFYVKKGNGWRYQGLESLQGITVGLIGGYAYEEEFNALVKRSNDKDRFQAINEDNALELNIRKILRGRITATVESVYVMNAKLEELGLTQDIVSAGTLTSGELMYIACSPKRPSSKQYLRWIDEGTQRLRRNGELQKILSRYGLTDWKPQAQQ